MSDSLLLTKQLSLAWVLLIFASSFFFSASKLDDEDVESVSAFYGPGVFLAWVVLLTKILVTGELRELIRNRSLQSQPMQEKVETDEPTTYHVSKIRVNVDIAAMWLFWAVAAINVAVETYGSKPASFAQLEAARHFLRPVSLLACITFLSTGFGDFTTAPARSIGWYTIGMVNAWLFLGAPDSDDNVDFSYIYLMMLCHNMSGMISPKITSYRWVYVAFSQVFWVLSAGFFVLGYWKTMKRGKEITWGFPKSGSSLTDIDQTVPVLAALGLVLYGPAKGWAG